MLTLNEFKGKKHIVMDKPNHTVIMNRKCNNGWNCIMIPRKYSISDLSYHTYGTDKEAYEFYLARMESYGFKKFTVLTE